MHSRNQMSDSEKTEVLLRGFYADQGRLRGFIFTATRNYHATEEILQSTAITVAQKAAAFDFDREMSPWFSGIVKNLIQRWYRTQAKESHSVSLDLLEQCIPEPEDYESGILSNRHTALKSCIQKLPQHQREIIKLRYMQGKDCSGIASDLGRSVQSVYSLLKRLKLELRKCIEFQLTRQEAAS